MSIFYINPSYFKALMPSLLVGITQDQEARRYVSVNGGRRYRERVKNSGRCKNIRDRCQAKQGIYFTAFFCQGYVTIVQMMGGDGVKTGSKLGIRFCAHIFTAIRQIAQIMIDRIIVQLDYPTMI